MQDFFNWAELILYTSIITFLVVGVYQKFSSWINPFICINRMKKNFGLGVSTKQVKFSRMPDYDESDDMYPDEGCEGDGDDCEEEAALSEKDRIIRYYALALQEYQRLKEADKAKRKLINMS